MAPRDGVSDERQFSLDFPAWDTSGAAGHSPLMGGTEAARAFHQNRARTKRKKLAAGRRTF